MDAAPPDRVAITPAAAELLRHLYELHGPLMFHQSGGCCDGSAPMCYPAGEFLTCDADVRLGELAISTSTQPCSPVPVWMSRNQFRYWSHTQLTIDVVPGRGAGFSLEAPSGMRFLTRSRLFTTEESDLLDAADRDNTDDDVPRRRTPTSRPGGPIGDDARQG